MSQDVCVYVDYFANGNPRLVKFRIENNLYDVTFYPTQFVLKKSVKVTRDIPIDSLLVYYSTYNCKKENTHREFFTHSGRVGEFYKKGKSTYWNYSKDVTNFVGNILDADDRDFQFDLHFGTDFKLVNSMDEHEEFVNYIVQEVLSGRGREKDTTCGNVYFQITNVEYPKLAL